MKDSFSQDVYWTLRDASYRLKKDLRDKMTDSGITWPQFHALYHIGEQGVPVNELAREINCNASNATGLIDRMAENEWVYREHSEEDRRVWLVKLTTEGKELKDRLIPEHDKNIKDRMSILDEQELITLKRLLDKLIQGE